jgi:acetyl-CoA carboxylase biotin carboxyl carrier protein
MNPKEIKELIEFLVEKDIAEFELERGDLKMRVKRGVEAHVVAAPPVPYAPAAHTPAMAAASAANSPSAAPAPAPVAPASSVAHAEEEELHIVRSPIVGTFYEAPSPGAPPFAKIGDVVKAGQPLCIVEAMKLMNEIEADASGEIVKIYVSNAQPVEYGQPLFGIRAR